MHPFIVTSIVTQLFFRNTDYIKKKMEAQIEQHNKRENNISNIKQLNMQCTAPLDTSCHELRARASNSFTTAASW
jgi:MFS superfamily sulfate permease-like transporter